MLERARELPVFNGTATIPVLLPEDLIALKIQAMVNAPDRKIIDLADIQLLLDKFHGEIDWDILRDHFRLFDLEAMYEEYRQKYKPKA